MHLLSQFSKHLQAGCCCILQQTTLYFPGFKPQYGACAETDHNLKIPEVLVLFPETEEEELQDRRLLQLL